MKKIILFATFLLLTGITAVHAQQKWEWEQYGLSFSAPSNFEVIENTEDSFEALNRHIHLAIEVFDYEGLDPEDLGMTLGELALELGMRNVDIGELRLTTLEGAYIESIEDGVGTILILLLDEDSNIALLASIIYDEGFERAATNICNSFAIK